MSMEKPQIDKVTVHMGVGESGQPLIDAEDILREITGQQPVRTHAKKTQPAFDIKKGEPIGVKVTLRGKKAKEFLETALGIIGKELSSQQFDENGTFSFGIEEHTDFPGLEYDPNIGIYGMDVNVTLKRPGYRVRRRKIKQSKVGSAQKLDKQSAIDYVNTEFGVEVI